MKEPETKKGFIWTDCVDKLCPDRYPGEPDGTHKHEVPAVLSLKVGDETKTTARFGR